MNRTSVLIVCCCAAALIACGKDKDKDSRGGSGGGDEPAVALPDKSTWQLGEFLVEIESPKDWVFWDLDADFNKVTFAKGDGEFAESTMVVATTCDGSCDFEKFPANIAETAKESLKFAGDGAAWDKELTEVKPGVWAYRLREKGMRGEKLKIRVAHLNEAVDDAFLACTAELVDKDMSLADEIEKLCTELAFEVKDSGKPVEGLFGGTYTFDEFTIEAPTPPDWKFSNYSIQWGRVVFKRGFGTKLEVGATCGGRCKAEQFAENIKGEATQDYESMSRDGQATWVKELSEVKPGTWLHRIRRTKDGQPDEEHIKVASIRKGAEHYFYCRADLSKDDLGLADSMEKYCLDRAAEAMQ